MNHISVIDFRSSGTQSDPQKLAQIHQACRQVGFMYLDCGFSPQQLEQVFTQAQQFFSLPLEVKQRIPRSPLTNCGYVPMQAERLNPERPGDLKEALNIGAATDWMPEPVSLPVITQFYHDAIEVALQILQAFARILDLPEHFFTERHRQNCFLRLLHYPPLTTPIASQIRAGEHTDYGSITLLFQQSEGLEIQTPQGDWVAVPLVPTMVLVNMGDAMQRWTNDYFRSTPHRVMNPDGMARDRSRYSLALFCDPDPEVEIACLPHCLSSDRPARYPPVRYADYLQAKFTATYSSS